MQPLNSQTSGRLEGGFGPLLPFEQWPGVARIKAVQSDLRKLFAAIDFVGISNYARCVSGWSCVCVWMLCGIHICMTDRLCWHASGESVFPRQVWCDERTRFSHLAHTSLTHFLAHTLDLGLALSPSQTTSATCSLHLTLFVVSLFFCFFLVTHPSHTFLLLALLGLAPNPPLLTCRQPPPTFKQNCLLWVWM